MNPGIALRDGLNRVFAVFGPPRHVAGSEHAQAAYMSECLHACMRHIPTSANLETVEIIARNAADSVIQNADRLSWPTPKELAAAVKWAAGDVLAKQRLTQPAIERDKEPPCYVGPGFWPWYYEQRKNATALTAGLLDGYANRRRALEAGRLEGHSGHPLPVSLAGGYQHHEPQAAE